LSFTDNDTPTMLLPVMELLIYGYTDTAIACYGVTVTRIPCALLVGHGYTNSLDTVISYIDIIVT